MVFSIGSQKPKSRKGKISTNVSTLLSQTVHDKRKEASVFHSFSDELRKIAFDIRDLDDERAQVQEFTNKVKKRVEPRNSLEEAALNALRSPVKKSLSRGVRGFIDTPGNLNRRISGAAQEVTSIGSKDLANEAFSAAAKTIGKHETDAAQNKIREAAKDVKEDLLRKRDAQ